MKVKQATEYADCSKRLLYDWLKRGLRHVRINGTIRTRPEWIDEFLMQGEVNHNELDEIVNDVCKGLL